MIMLLLFVIGAVGVGGYLYIKMKGVKPASRKSAGPDADYHDEDEDALQLPEDDDEDEEVDVNEDYEAESDDEPV